ncbi:hypothetical protein [Variovorax sp. J31P207]|uniref:hypothetical protein n=1 Tax=Variovorax sp. J31P207 TaxID=3053510 RepID=UPI002574A042|nr:hypothetical protein [Variovorax sp. J31P207]MDM0065762.1 hypothetical protein [Variovorax sp. J31P207]
MKPHEAFALLMACALGPATACAQGLDIVGSRIQQHANGVLALMAYQAVPDLTSSSLSITNPTSGNPGIVMSQLGGGFTVSKSLPLYLEGAIAYSRYDPVFVASNGVDARQLPTRWNSLSGTAGIGWDFPIAPELAFRPIFNFSLGKVASDLQVARAYLGHVTDRQLDFLDGGSLNAYGLGGAVMLDWEHYRQDYEVDVELRYSDIELKSYGSSSAAVEGSASARTANLWARWRAPTGLQAFDRPLRYVLEFSHSRYLGSQADVLGFDRLTTLGTGLELDTSAHDIFITRIRAVVRYVFGNNVSGFSLGLAVSF